MLFVPFRARDFEAHECGLCGSGLARKEQVWRVCGETVCSWCAASLLDVTHVQVLSCSIDAGDAIEADAEKVTTRFFEQIRTDR